MHSITMNIPYDMSAEDWTRLAAVYEAMLGWQGYLPDGCPVWYPDGPDKGEISASVEPSGLLLEGDVSEATWKLWLSEFMQRTSAALGFAVRDAEE